jgi:hypothetical protein
MSADTATAQDDVTAARAAVEWLAARPRSEGLSGGRDEIRMSFKAILMGLFGARADKEGLWDFLAKRSADKRRVELERTRNEGTQSAILSLRSGMMLREGGPDWSREIIAPGGAGPGVLSTAVASPLPAVSPAPAISDSVPQRSGGTAYH